MMRLSTPGHIDFGFPSLVDGQLDYRHFVDLAALEAERAIAVTVDFVLHALHVAIPVVSASNWIAVFCLFSPGRSPSLLSLA